MTYLLWVRTKRRITTYDDADLERLMEFEAALRSPQHFGRIELRDPIEGEDQLLYQVESLARIHDVATAFSTVMDDYFVDDWCLTEVGNALAPLPYEEADDDDNFDAELDDNKEEIESSLPEGYSFTVPELGFGGLAWNSVGLAGNFRTGAIGLWVDLEHDLEDARGLLRRLESALPRPTKRMWAGRRSLLFAYVSEQGPQSRTFMGLSETVLGILGGDDIAMWVAFQIGNWSVGGVLGDMGQLADFIRKLPSRKVA